MELRHLRYFLAVAEELHFGRAAARCHLAQPPLSQQIKDLEREVGAELFRRNSRNVALTPAGEALLAHARAALREAERGAEAARAAAAGTAGRLDLGFVNPAMDGFLSRAIAAFRREAPDVRLTLHELGSREQLEALRAGRLHAGFIRLAGQDVSGLAHEVLHRDRYVAALPRGHRLTKLKRVPLAELAREPLILYPRDTGPALYDAMLAALRTALPPGHPGPAIAQEARSKHTTLSLVAAGLGVALVPGGIQVWRREGVVLREVAGALPDIELAVVRPEPEPPALARLLAAARAAGRE
ncbi:MAG: LysR family transcriptional regulator [Desulfovibrionaceae bacterium]